MKMKTDLDGDGKFYDYDEMMEVRMLEKTSKIVCPPGFDIFEDSSRHDSYLDDDDDDDFDDDYDEFDDDEFDEDFDDDWGDDF